MIKPIIDCDVHHNFHHHSQLYPYLEQIWIDRMEKSGFGYPKDYFISSIGSHRLDSTPLKGVAGSDRDLLIDQLFNKHNITYALLNGSGIAGVSNMMEKSYPMALAKEHNRWTLNEWLNYDSRFLGSIHIAIQCPIESAEEIRKMAKYPQFKSVALPSVLPLPISHDFYSPVLEAINETGLVLLFHPKQPSHANPSMSPIGTLNNYLEWHTLAGLPYMAQLTSMVVQGVFEKYKNLKVFFIEGGTTWVPSLMWRLDKNYKALRSEAPWLKHLPSKYIQNHCKFCTQPIEEPPKKEYLSQIYEMMDGNNTIIFSTDYPHWDFDTPNFAMKDIPRKWHSNILFNNAANFLNININE